MENIDFASRAVRAYRGCPWRGPDDVADDVVDDVACRGCSGIYDRGVVAHLRHYPIPADSAVGVGVNSALQCTWGWG